MKHHHRAFGLLLTIGLVGCGAETPDFPDVAPVTGTVTYQGKPVEGANVRFIPSAGEGNPAMATTDAEGHYTLSTTFSSSVTEEGAVPGNYSVLVIKLTKAEIDPNAAHDEVLVKEPPKNLLPREFSIPSSTPFKATVEAGKDNEVPLDLDARGA